jgi:hypothetical protein
MKPTKALYVDWFMPRKYRGSNSLYKKPWEIAMIIRSTHFSKDVNKLSPVLYCDPEVYEYYKNTGLDSCFDEIYPTLPLEPKFNPAIFWAAGKFYAIRDMKENFLMMDLDAEIRFELDLSGMDLFCSHVEDIYSEDLNYYPRPEYLDTDNFLGREYHIEWGNKAYNTSVLYFKDLEIAKEYSNKALEFIESISNINPAFERGYILLAEQRFLYEFAKVKNLNVETLISGLYKPGDSDKKLPAVFENSNVDEIGKKGFLHVWGFKNQIHGAEEAEQTLFGQLIASRLNLRDLIVECVTKNREIYGPKLFLNENI